jgi:RNA polymerase sigma-70 factor (ECF subfamily)
MPVDDLTILALRAKAGDRQALDRFVADSRGDVHRLCSYLGRPADPDDLTQETFERALHSLHRYRGDGPARSWLLSIARRVCVDATRRRGRRQRLDDRLTRDATSEHRDHIWLEVTDALEVLDRDRYEAFVMTQFMGMSYAEAADALECAVGTIRSRVARARMQLIDHLDSDEVDRSA